MIQKEKPLISVILPVYNAEKYLHEAVNSILNQTITDFELIAIDDGSVDNSLEILQSFASKNKRIIVISRENKGLSKTLNEGIEIARGKWIARMDADDISLPNRFELQLEHLQKTNADLCGGAIEYIGDWRWIYYLPITHEACEALMLFSPPFDHPTVIGRSEIFKTLRYNSEFDDAEDYDLWQRAWSHGIRFTNVNQVILKHRVHINQVSSKKKLNQQMLFKKIIERHWKAIFPDVSQFEVEIVHSAIYGEGSTDKLVPIFNRALSKYSGEALKVFLFNAYTIFCKLACNSKSPAIDWFKLVKRFDIVNIQRALVIGLLKLLGAGFHTKRFLFLKRLYSNYRLYLGKAQNFLASKKNVLVMKLIFIFT